MRKSTAIVIVTLALLSSGVAAGQSADGLVQNMVGTWKLNPAKSTYDPGPAVRSNTIKIERWENGLKAIQDGIDATGKATHVEASLKFDGKDYARKGVPEPNATRAYRRVDDR